jgi:hypothetical protein
MGEIYFNVFWQQQFSLQPLFGWGELREVIKVVESIHFEVPLAMNFTFKADAFEPGSLGLG